MPIRLHSVVTSVVRRDTCCYAARSSSFKVTKPFVNTITATELQMLASNRSCRQTVAYWVQGIHAVARRDGVGRVSRRRHDGNSSLHYWKMTAHCLCAGTL